MEKIIDFRVQIVQDANTFTATLFCEGDEFEIEVDDPKELEDEVVELIQEKLATFGVVLERN